MIADFPQGSILDQARAYHAAGFSVIPIKPGGSKAPVLNSWKQYQTQPIDAETLPLWFAGNGVGIAIVCGDGSGGVELIDIDRKDIAPEYWERIELVAPGLLAKLSIVETPEGFHVWFRTEPSVIQGNQKLAMDPDGKVALIETRGRGGYALVPGGAPEAHATGKPYVLRRGPALESMTRITADEREALFDAARSLDQRPPTDPIEAPKQANADVEASPGDAFAALTPWKQILPSHGWQLVYERGELGYWRRPGKTIGISATTGLRSKSGNEILYVFTSNGHPFDGMTSYTKFAAYCILNHGGDFHAAAKHLVTLGFGDKPRSGLPDLRPPELREDLADHPPEDRLRTKGKLHSYQPFPVQVLPNILGAFVSAAAECLGCFPESIALPALVTCSAAIGNSRLIELKRGWRECAVLWGVQVQPSGTMKSPADEIATRPLANVQQDAFDEYHIRLAEYEISKAEYDVAKKHRGKKAQQEQEALVEPTRPVCFRVEVSDTTVEGLIPILQANPRGLMLHREELAGWLGSFDKYAGGKAGSDESAWLSMHAARAITVDRKTGDQRTLYVPKAFVAVCGTIQPQVLNRSLGKAHKESGLAARLLMVHPPRQAKRWNENEISELIEEQYSELIFQLLELEMEEDKNGRPQPRVVYLTPDAKELWVKFVNDHGVESVNLPEDLGAAFAKLEAAAARFALIFAMINGENAVSAVTMQAALELTAWFKHETRRIYQIFGETPPDQKRRELVETIANLSEPNKGITANDLRRRSRRFKTSEEAELALNGLVAAGLGEWHRTSQGRPTQYFRLTALVSVSDIKAEENETFGYTCRSPKEAAVSETPPDSAEIDDFGYGVIEDASVSDVEPMVAQTCHSTNSSPSWEEF